MVNQSKREFGAMKWLFVIALTAVLGGIVGYFNLRIFGLEDGLPYAFAVACIGGGAVCIAHYVGSENKTLARAAFVFDVALFIVLILSAAYSISGLRELSLAKQTAADNREAIKDIKELKSKTAQRDLGAAVAAKYSRSEDVQQIFKQYERPLFYLLVAELSVFGLAMFTMIGLAFLPDRDGNGVPDIFESKAEVEAFDQVGSAEQFNRTARPKGQ